MSAVGGSHGHKEGPERGELKGMQKENIFPEPLDWKTRGAEFYEFRQTAKLKACRFKGQQSWLG